MVKSNHWWEETMKMHHRYPCIHVTATWVCPMMLCPWAPVKQYNFHFLINDAPIRIIHFPTLLWFYKIIWILSQRILSLAGWNLISPFNLFSDANNVMYVCICLQSSLHHVNKPTWLNEYTWFIFANELPSPNMKNAATHFRDEQKIASFKKIIEV